MGSPDPQSENKPGSKRCHRVFVSGAMPDNQPQNKRVESIEIACLDPGSTPGDSTTYLEYRVFIRIKPKRNPFMVLFGFFNVFFRRRETGLQMFGLNFMLPYAECNLWFFHVYR